MSTILYEPRNAALRADIKKGLRKPQSLLVIPAGFKPTTF